MLKLSVLVPIYNVEWYLEEALQSLLDQHLQDVEFICVNDGSTDHSGDILARFASKDPRFIVINQENHGYGYSVNRALERARGEYVVIFEPDDFVDPNMYADLYEEAKKNDLDIVKCGFYIHQLTKRGYEHIDETYYLPDQTEDVFTVYESPIQLKQHPAIWSSLMRRSLIEEFHLRLVEAPGSGWTDNPFFVATMLRARRIKYLKKPYYYWRVTTARDEDALKDYRIPFDRISDILAYIKESGLDLPDRVWEYLYLRFLIYIDLVLRMQHISDRADCFARIQALVSSMDENIVLHSSATPFWLKDIFVRFRYGTVGENFVYQAPKFNPKILIDKKFFANTKENKYPDFVYDPGKIEISVILPLLEANDFAASTVYSVKNQDYPFWELICVCDESLRDSLGFLEEYATSDGGRDERIRILYREKVTESAAYNVALQEAAGKYLFFINDTLILKSDALDKFSEKIQATNADVVVCGCEELSEGGHIEATPWTSMKDIIPNRDIFSLIHAKNHIFQIFSEHTTDKVFRSDYIRNLGIEFQTLPECGTAFFVFMALVFARKITIHFGNLVFKIRLEQEFSATTMSFFFVIEEIKRYLTERNFYKIVQLSFINWVIEYTFKNIQRCTAYVRNKFLEKIKRSNLYRIEHFQKLAYSKTAYNVLSNIQSDTPCVTLLVPIHSPKEDVERCLKSLLAQTFYYCTIRCLDCGSDDAIREMLDAYQRKDKRLSVLQVQDTQDVVDAHIADARSDYVAVINSHDYVDEAFVSRLYIAACENDFDFIQCDYFKYDINKFGKFNFQPEKILHDNRFYNKVLNTSKADPNFGSYIYPLSGLYKKHFLLKNGIKYNRRISEALTSNDFFISIFTHATRGCFVNECLYMEKNTEIDTNTPDTASQA